MTGVRIQRIRPRDEGIRRIGGFVSVWTGLKKGRRIIRGIETVETRHRLATVEFERFDAAN